MDRAVNAVTVVLAEEALATAHQATALERAGYAVEEVEPPDVKAAA